MNITHLFNENWHTDPEQQSMDATRRARLGREREPAGSDAIDARLAANNNARQQYAETGHFWLKQKDTQKHLNDQPYVGKAAANAAALELLKQQPELRGNLVITAYGPGEQQVTEGRVKELGQDLKDKAMSDNEFKAKYGKTRAEVRAAMREKQGVAEGSDNIRSMIQQYEDMVELVYDLPPGRKKNIAIDKRDALEAQIEAMPGGSEALRKWARAYNDSFDEGVAEGKKKPHPQTWHDVDPKLGKAVDKMSQAEKVKKGYAHPDTLKKKGVAEGLEQMVGFHLDSERAYEAVMAKFGHVIDHDEDSGTMYVPERLWPTVEATAYDADGIGAQRDDELENPEHYGVDEAQYDSGDYYNARIGAEYGRDLNPTGNGGPGAGTKRDDIFKGQSNQLPADPFGRTSGAVPRTGTGRIHSTALPDEMDEGEKVGSMDADRFDAAMARLKQLAGAGPMRTVYDPEKRVYKNVPVAQQPGDKK